MKSQYFNGAKRGKPAIILLVNNAVEIDAEPIANSVGTPLFIRWHKGVAPNSIEVHYDIVGRELGYPQTTLHLIDGELSWEAWHTALFHLNPVVPPSPLHVKPEGEIRIYNPVRRALEQNTAKEYLDPELEKLLALLAECI